MLDGAPETLLESYQAERMPSAQGVLQLSTALYKRGAKQRRGAATKQLGTHYRDSVLAVGGGNAGERAPDGVIAMRCDTPRAFELDSYLTRA